MAVTGNVDTAILVKKLRKSGKHAELLSAPKGGSNYTNTNNFNKIQTENGKWQQQQQENRMPKIVEQHQLKQQMKGFKDLGLNLKNLKDSKSVKFNLPAASEFCGDWSDSEDEDCYDDDNEDFFDVDFEKDFRGIKINPKGALPNGNRVTTGHRNGGSCLTGGSTNGKKGVNSIEIQPQFKRTAPPMKIFNTGGTRGGGVGGPKVGSEVDGGYCTGGVRGGGGGNEGGGANKWMGADVGGWKKGSGGLVEKNDGSAAMVGGKNVQQMMGQGFHHMDVGQMGKTQASRTHMGDFPAGGCSDQVRPLGGAPAGYFQPGIQAPSLLYQQQYMAAMQQQHQQQQRMMMMNNGQGGAVHPIMWGYQQPAAVQCAAPVPAQGEPYTNLFSDENASGCSIM